MAELAEGGGLKIRQVVRPSDTNQQLTAQSITQIWGVLGGFGSKMCNRMCNSTARGVEPRDATALRLGIRRSMLRPYANLTSTNIESLLFFRPTQCRNELRSAARQPQSVPNQAAQNPWRAEARDTIYSTWERK